MAEVVAVCIGEQRGGAKQPVEKAYLRRDHGLEGDAHAGPGRRQVALLDWGRVEELRQDGINARPGDFAENIDLKGIDFNQLRKGVILQIGPSVLEITERGKPEWRPGDYSFQGTALTAREGVFGRVLKGGWVKRGAGARIQKKGS